MICFGKSTYARCGIIVKAQVPIWKKELYADGSEWLDGTPVRAAGM